MRTNEVLKAERKAARQRIEKELADTQGNVSTAARQLGMTRQGLIYRMKELEIDARDFMPGHFKKVQAML